jgi:hypothetical protein
VTVGREELLRKADQHYEMAGLARQDGDAADAARHLKLANEYDAKAKEAE